MAIISKAKFDNLSKEIEFHSTLLFANNSEYDIHIWPMPESEKPPEFLT